jgi:hypothetical protein
LAFGSLIGDPGPEIEAIEIKAERRRNVRTPFPVEFARASQKRAGAPTLVPHQAGCPVAAEIIVLEATEKLAKDALWRRETDNLGSSNGYIERATAGENTLLIERFENLDGLSVVFAAFFRATIANPTAARLAELAVASAKDRALRPRRDGISYLLAAKRAGIVTPLSPAYEAEILRLTGASRLEDARAMLHSS